MKLEAKASFDVIVIGTGIAGLACVEEIASKSQLSIGLFSNSSIQKSPSNYAQGGIAGTYGLSQAEKQQHFVDSLKAGDGLCKPEVVEFVISQSDRVFDKLLELNMPFDRDTNGNFALRREGGHSSHRVWHSKDHTGRSLIETFSRKIEHYPRIYSFVSSHFVIHLHTLEGRVCGIVALSHATGELEFYSCRQLVLACGGLCHLYKHSTQKQNIGEGIALAWLAGAEVANLEMTQFHPTVFFDERSKSIFLLSEALRGDGAKIINQAGQEFLHATCEDGELSSRDKISKAIFQELQQSNASHAYLDLRHLDQIYLKDQYPNIYAFTTGLGYDPATMPLPIVPAAHYSCGGVKTNLQAETNIRNLFVIGENACTGLHGANRLASNSLLECIVFAQQAAISILERGTAEDSEDADEISLLHLKTSQNLSLPHEEKTFARQFSGLQEILWHSVGIFRKQSDLAMASLRVENLLQKAQDEFFQEANSYHKARIYFASLVASLVIESALARKESRGCHWIQDFPGRLERAEDSVLVNC